MPSQKIHISWYITGDYIAAVTTCMLLYVAGKLLLQESLYTQGQPNLNQLFLMGVVLIPLGWITYYFLTGSYNFPYKNLRLNEIAIRFFFSLIGWSLAALSFVYNNTKRPVTFDKDVDIKILHNQLDILTGSIKTTDILSPVPADIRTGLMPEWQQNIKRLMDIIL